MIALPSQPHSSGATKQHKLQCINWQRKAIPKPQHNKIPQFHPCSSVFKNYIFYFLVIQMKTTTRDEKESVTLMKCNRTCIEQETNKGLAVTIADNLSWTKESCSSWYSLPVTQPACIRQGKYKQAARKGNRRNG